MRCPLTVIASIADGFAIHLLLLLLLHFHWLLSNFDLLLLLFQGSSYLGYRTLGFTNLLLLFL